MQFDKTTDMTPAWVAFRSGADPSVREQVIEFYLPFARIMAAKLYAKRTYIELEFSDYMQYASIGLMEAIDRFDPDRGVKFETFAAPRITGAILNGIESLSEKQVQVSARQRILAARVKSLKDEAPEPADSNAVFGYLAELAVELAIGFALEDSGVSQSEEASYPDNTYHRVELKQLRQRIDELVGQLPDNERRVVKYHYLQQVPFDEIATLLGVTKGRVSQIHKNALKRLGQIIRSIGEIDLRC
ncbi:MAG TPA: sigma-70 family RNA polymerase sigma factor [Noviherbaspirillum sp.]